MRPPKIRTNGQPVLPAVGRLKYKIRSRIKNVRIHRRKHQRLRPHRPNFLVAHRKRRHVLHLPCAPVIFRNLRPPSPINNVRIKRIRRHISIFNRPHRMPFAVRNLAIIPARGNAHRSALLLPAAHAIRKSLRRANVIHLRRRLVVPGTPSLAAIHRHQRPLIGHQQNNFRIIRIDPKILIIIPARRPANARPGLPTVRRTHRHNARAINHIRIFRVRPRDRQISAANTHSRSRIGGNLRPIFPRIIRAIKSQPFPRSIFPSLVRPHRRIDPLRIAGRHGNINLHQVFRQPIRQLLPSTAAIGRFKKPAARPAVRIPILPRPLARFPQTRIQHIRIRRVHLNIRPARILILIKHAFPSLPAIHRTKNPALLIRTKRMPQHRRKQSIRIRRINHHRRNLLAIAQTKMRPGFSSIARFINSISHRKVRPLQSLPASHINNVRIRRRHRNRPNRLRRLRIKNRRPSPPIIIRFPNPAIHCPDIKQIRRARNASHSPSPPPAKWPNRTPSQFLISTRRKLLRAKRHRTKNTNHKRHQNPPSRHNPHPPIKNTERQHKSNPPPKPSAT